MLGQNKITHMSQLDTRTFGINSIFATIQGEGPDAGTPAVFLRLSGCNLRCYWCDTNFDNNSVMSIESILEEINSKRGASKLVVITGGEPLLQNLVLLIEEINKVGMLVQIETAGTPTPRDTEILRLQFTKMKYKKGNTIVCSPKTPKIAEWIIPYVSAWKYIITDEPVSSTDGLPIYSTQISGKKDLLFRPPSDHPAPIFVQPCDFSNFQDKYDDIENSSKAVEQTINSAMKFGYRISIQLHKMLELD